MLPYRSSFPHSPLTINLTNQMPRNAKKESTKALIMARREEIESAMKVIARFYDDEQAALSILRSAPHLPGGAERFRDVEETLYRKRLKNGVPRKIHLLKVALDDAPLRAGTGHTAGAPAFQAEMMYNGKW